MVEVLLFIVGLLIGAGILFIVSQKKVTQLVKDRNRLFSEVAVKTSPTTTPAATSSSIK